MISLNAQPLCLSQYSVAKNAQNSVVYMVGTDFHWLKKAYGICSCVLLFVGNKVTRFQNHTKRLTQEPWTMPSGFFILMGTSVHNMHFPLRQSSLLIFQILLWVMLPFGSSLCLIYFFESIIQYLFVEETSERMK